MKKADKLTCPPKTGPKPMLGLGRSGGRNNGKTEGIFSRADHHETARGRSIARRRQEHKVDLTVLGDMKKGFSFIVSSPTDLIAQDPESILDNPEGGLRILSKLKELTHDENEFRIEPYGISFFKSSENECLAGISLQNLNEALKYAWENLDNKA